MKCNLYLVFTVSFLALLSASENVKSGTREKEVIKLGAEVAEVKPYGVKVIEIFPKGLASKLELKEGDVIVKVNATKIDSMNALTIALKGNFASVVWKRGDVHIRREASKVYFKNEERFQEYISESEQVLLRNDRVILIGNIGIKNNYDSEVSISLYAPDAPAKAFATWKFSSTQRGTLVNEKKELISFDGDWKIEIVFGNGVRSARHRVSTVGTRIPGGWEIYATRIYDPEWREPLPTK